MNALAECLDECAMAARYAGHTWVWPIEITVFMVAAVATTVILAVLVANWDRNRAAEAQTKLGLTLYKERGK